MIEKVYSDPQGRFEWIDVTAPSQLDFQLLTDKYDIHETTISDILNPEHLPKQDHIEGLHFAILRAYDEQNERHESSIHALTTKLSIFVGKDFLVSVHRKDMRYLQQARKQVAQMALEEPPQLQDIVYVLWQQLLLSYEQMVQDLSLALDYNEERIVKKRRALLSSQSERIITDLYTLKRRAAVCQRMMSLNREVIQEYVRTYKLEGNPYAQDLRDTATDRVFSLDRLHENANNLLNTHLALSSHRTDRVLGSLTMVSFIFLPLTFMTGLYGMNFHYIPELDWHYGYFALLGIMVVVVVLVLLFFKRRGWL